MKFIPDSSVIFIKSLLGPLGGAIEVIMGDKDGALK